VSPLRKSKKKSLLAVPTKCKEERNCVAQALLPVRFSQLLQQANDRKEGQQRNGRSKEE
jgi:hypothetical protein